MSLPSHPCFPQNTSNILSEFLPDLSPLLLSLLLSHSSHASLILLAHLHAPVIYVRFFLLLRSWCPLYDRGNCAMLWDNGLLLGPSIPGKETLFRSMQCPWKTCS